MVSQCSSGDGLELGGGRNHIAAAVWGMAGLPPGATGQERGL